MKIAALVGAIGFCLAKTDGYSFRAFDTDERSSDNLPDRVAFDQIQAYLQPTSLGISDNAASNFKPLLSIGEGKCYPVPAVSKEGEVNDGIVPLGANCTKAPHGSQVYARSDWFGGFWATIYAWFIPSATGGSWINVIVWINNPAANRRQIVGVSIGNKNRYSSEVPPDFSKVKGRRLKLSYNDDTLSATTEEGHGQELILWAQLSGPAQDALNNQLSFPGNECPLNDKMFRVKLGSAYPFPNK